MDKGPTERQILKQSTRLEELNLTVVTGIEILDQKTKTSNWWIINQTEKESKDDLKPDLLIVYTDPR